MTIKIQTIYICWRLQPYWWHTNKLKIIKLHWAKYIIIKSSLWATKATLSPGLSIDRTREDMDAIKSAPGMVLQIKFIDKLEG